MKFEKRDLIRRDVRLGWRSLTTDEISDPPDAPSDFEIVIEHENHIEKDLKGSLAAIEGHQDWSRALA
jgi:hypothetical protein